VNTGGGNIRPKKEAVSCQPVQLLRIKLWQKYGDVRAVIIVVDWKLAAANPLIALLARP
jgi:hypothetical protein